MRRCELLVVGLGPAGGAAAAAGARLGLQVLAVERKREVGLPVQCAEFVPLPVAPYARAPGVLAQRVRAMRTVLPSGAEELSPFTGLMVERAAFDRALARAAERAGAALELGCRLVALDPARSVALLRSPRGSREIAYRVLVAADGPRSTVTALLGLAPLQAVSTRQYTVPLAAPAAETTIWLSAQYPGGYAWLFPKGTRANLGVGMDRRLELDLKTALDRLQARLVAEGRIGPGVLCATGGPIPVGGLRRPLVAGTVLFAGDAAGLTHPVTGAGIAAALASGERAAQAAFEWLRQGRAGALEDYEAELRGIYQDSVERALARRRELLAAWRAARAGCDAVQRRGWIAFDDYYRAQEEAA